MKFLITIALFSLMVLAKSSPTVMEDDMDRTRQIISETAARQAELWKDIEIHPRIADEAMMTGPELIASRGYPIEVHYVTTSDGYILQLHRIPYGRKSGPAENKKPILVMHGILQSASDWVITSNEQGLAYILADQGFDVWLGNARGTTYSRNHTTLKPSSSKFWKFSWNEIGTIDLPTKIDYILKQTGQDALHYVGYSQGTTSFFVMTSNKPEYNDKIKVATLMAPIAFMTNMFSPILRLAASFDGVLETLFPLFGVNEFLPSSKLLAVVGDLLCGDTSLTQMLCTNALFAICGFSASEMNATLLPTLMGHTPAGSSTRQLFHYAQEINSKKFRKYDFGMLTNLAEYGSIAPPNYPHEKITTPIFLFYSKGDWLSNEVDVETFCGKLANCNEIMVNKETWNHLDYTYGINVKRLVYDKLVSLQNRY